MRIQAFRALRPAPSKVDEVASVPYDTINTDEARELAAGKSSSFLHVIRPEIDLPPECDVHDAAVYAKAAENFQRFQDSGVLLREEAPCLYLYRQQMGAHIQRGVVACSLPCGNNTTFSFRTIAVIPGIGSLLRWL